MGSPIWVKPPQVRYRVAGFGAVAHAATRGQRDFTSRSSLQASQYAVTVDPGEADQARQLLTRLNWQT